MRTWIGILSMAAIMLLPGCKGGNGDYDASGVFEATEVIVSSQANGLLLEFNVREGRNLEENRPVGLVDTVQLHLKKMQLLANIKAVETRRVSIAKQIAATQQQIATQETEQKRYENLVKSNAANQKQLDDINAQIALLQKQLAAQTETLENSNRSVFEEIDGLKIQVEQTEDLLEKSIVYSPIKGTVLTKYSEQGEFVTQGKALFKIADINQMNLRAYITSDQLSKMKIGQNVRVFADFGEKAMKEYPGTVIWISDVAEFTPKTIQTRNERANLVYAVKIAVNNDGLLKRGMYGEIKIN